MMSYAFPYSHTPILSVVVFPAKHIHPYTESVHRGACFCGAGSWILHGIGAVHDSAFEE